VPGRVVGAVPPDLRRIEIVGHIQKSVGPILQASHLLMQAIGLGS
jgi:hypothetical protein